LFGFHSHLQHIPIAIGQLQVLVERFAAARSGVAGGAASSIIGRAAYILSRFALSALVISRLSLEEYGVWAVCFIVIGYMGTGAFGITGACVRYIAQFQAEGKKDQIEALLSTALAAGLVLAAIVVATFTAFLPPLLSALNVPNELAPRAYLVISACVTAFAFCELVFGVFASALEGLERIPQRTSIWLTAALLESIFAFILVWHGWGLIGLTAAFILRVSVAAALNLWLLRLVVPGIQVRLSRARTSSLSPILKFGGVVQISGMLSFAIFSAQKFGAGFFFGIAGTGLFEAGQKLATLAYQTVSSVNGVLLPASVRRLHEAGRKTAGPLYIEHTRLVAILAGVVLAFIAAFSDALILLWAGPLKNLADASFISVCFATALAFHVTTGPAGAIHKAMEAPSKELVYNILQAILLCAAGTALFVSDAFEIRSLALTASLAMIVSSVAYQALNLHWFNTRAGEFLSRAGTPFLAAFLAAAISRWLIASIYALPGSRMDAALWVSIGAACYIVLCLGTAAIAATKEERDRVTEWIKRIRVAALRKVAA
jgi:O-antigen/teichoic acid export membrane protein